MNLLGRANLSTLIPKIVQYLSDIFPLCAGGLLGWIFMVVLEKELSLRTGIACIIALVIFLLAFISALFKQTLRKVIESPATVVVGFIIQLSVGFPYDRCSPIAGLIVLLISGIILSFLLGREESSQQ